MHTATKSPFLQLLTHTLDNKITLAVQDRIQTRRDEDGSTTTTMKDEGFSAVITENTTDVANPQSTTTNVIVIKHSNHQKEQQRQKRRKAWTCRVCVTCMVFAYAAAYVTLSSNPKDILEHANNEITFVDEGHITPSTTTTTTTTASLYESHLQEIQSLAYSVSTIYQPVPPSVWCVDEMLSLDQLKRRPMGLCYLKMPRAASDTLRGVNMRIARNFGQRHGLRGCIRHDSHTVGMYYTHREKKLSYLWTFVRDPTDRALSVAGMKLSQQLLGSNTSRDSFDAVAEHIPTMPPTTTEMLNSRSSVTAATRGNFTKKVLNLLQHATNIHDGILSEGRGGFQLQFAMQSYIEAYSVIDPDNPTEIIDRAKLLREVSRVFMRFDFVGVVERFDESLVAMQLLLGLEPSDVLYFATNTRKQWRQTKISRRKFACRKPFDWEVDFITEPTLQEYLTNNPEWYAQNYGDYLLYHAANQSLDRTILQIGLDVFAYELKKFKHLLKQAHDVCHAQFSCSEDGEYQPHASEIDCMEPRIGCGFQCLDALTQISPNSTDTLYWK